MKDLVTVLMSVHNEPAPFIDTAVGSICAQTYNDIELIIIDDASTPRPFPTCSSLNSGTLSSDSTATGITSD